MATFLVTTAVDSVDENDGKISLREAIALANSTPGEDTVVFSIAPPPALFIVSLGSAIQVTESVIIDGADTARLRAAEGQRIFTFSGDGASTLRNIELQGGDGGASGGGAIQSFTNLTLDGVSITGAETTGAGAHGGAVYVTGNLTVLDSRFEMNRTLGEAAQGGAVYATGNATIRDSVFIENGTAGSLATGGAVSVVNALTLTGSTFTANSTQGPNSPGGAVAAFSATVEDSAFDENLTAGSNSPGGALRATGPLTIATTDFDANATVGDDSPGGAASSGGELSIANSGFTGNSTGGDRSFGGGAATSAGLAVLDTTLSGNATAGVNAGGGALFSGLATSLNAVVIDGNATAGAGAEGGGLFARGNVIVDASTFSNNATAGAGAGGGGLAGEATVQFLRSTADGNATTGEDAPGGGLYAEGQLTIQASTLTGNSTAGLGSEGGGAYAQLALYLLSSTISANETAGAGAKGGGLFVGGAATISNATFADNSTGGSDAAGGALHAVGALSMFKSTLSGNVTSGPDSPGGAVWFETSRLYGDSILLGNAALGSGAGTNEEGGAPGAPATAIGTNLIGPDSADATDVFAQTYVLSGSILAGQLADNGGQVATIGLLEQGSNPAIDTGLPGMLKESTRQLDLTGDGDQADTITTDARGAGFDRDIDITGVGGGISNSGDLGAIEIPTVNRVPVALPDNRTVTESSGAILIDILANDSDPDEGDSFTLTGVELGGLVGIAQMVGQGNTLSYDPNGQFEYLGSGEASVQFATYTIEDMNGGVATGQISITVTGENDLPVAINDIVSVNADDPERLIDVLANDTEIDSSDLLLIQSINNSQTQGSARIAQGGAAILYDPNGAFDDLLPGQSAIDTLTYTVTDGNGGTDTAVVTFTVTGSAGPNLPPVARDDAVRAEQGEIVAIDVLANNGSGADSDPNAGDTLAVTAVGGAGKGLSFLAEDGSVLYRSNPGATGTDSFVYTLSDGRGGNDTATVTVTLDAPAGSGLSTGEAQRVALLFEAGLDRDGNISESGLNFHIDNREAGQSERALARLFLQSAEFEAKYGDPDTLSDQDLVEQLYLNTLNRPGSDAGIAFWTGVAGRPGVEAEDLLIAFANSFENIQNSPDVLSLEEVEPGTWAFV